MKGDISADRKGFYSNNRFRAMLERKDIYQLDSAFPFIAALADRAMVQQQRYPKAQVQTNFPELSHLLKREHLEHVQNF